MAKYLVEVETTSVVTYEVDADDRAGALIEYHSGHGVVVDNSEEEYLDAYPADE